MCLGGLILLLGLSLLPPKSIASGLSLSLILVLKAGPGSGIYLSLKTSNTSYGFPSMGSYPLPFLDFLVMLQVISCVADVVQVQKQSLIFFMIVPRCPEYGQCLDFSSKFITMVWILMPGYVIIVKADMELYLRLTFGWYRGNATWRSSSRIQVYTGYP